MGRNPQRIARGISVVHQTVANWVAAHADALPDWSPQPDGPVETAGLEALYTYGGYRKTLPTS